MAVWYFVFTWSSILLLCYIYSRPPSPSLQLIWLPFVFTLLSPLFYVSPSSERKCNRLFLSMTVSVVAYFFFFSTALIWVRRRKKQKSAFMFACLLLSTNVSECWRLTESVSCLCQLSFTTHLYFVSLLCTLAAQFGEVGWHGSANDTTQTHMALFPVDWGTTDCSTLVQSRLVHSEWHAYRNIATRAPFIGKLSSVTLPHWSQLQLCPSLRFNSRVNNFWSLERAQSRRAKSATN